MPSRHQPNRVSPASSFSARKQTKNRRYATPPIFIDTPPPLAVIQCWSILFLLSRVLAFRAAPFDIMRREELAAVHGAAARAPATRTLSEQFSPMPCHARVLQEPVSETPCRDKGRARTLIAIFDFLSRHLRQSPRPSAHSARGDEMPF